MSQTHIYHNPRCSKSRQALALLEGKQNVSVIEYLKTGLSMSTVETLFTQLDIDSALKMIRPKEPDFLLAGLTKDASNQDIFKALVEFPKLLERPLVVHNNKAVIGRPPELVETLFDD